MDLIDKNKKVLESEPDTRYKTELNADDWLCVVCNRKITSDKERFEYNNRNEFQFINPNGYSFDILTFSSADGCIELGTTTFEFTWFAGHSWSYALCSHCNNHLGWKYTGKYSFYGLIKSKLIKGAARYS